MCEAVSHEVIQRITDVTSLPIEDLSKPINSWTTNPNLLKFSETASFHIIDLYQIYKKLFLTLILLY